MARGGNVREWLFECGPAGNQMKSPHSLRNDTTGLVSAAFSDCHTTVVIATASNTNAVNANTNHEMLVRYVYPLRNSSISIHANGAPMMTAISTSRIKS